MASTSAMTTTPRPPPPRHGAPPPSRGVPPPPPPPPPPRKTPQKTALPSSKPPPPRPPFKRAPPPPPPPPPPRTSSQANEVAKRNAPTPPPTPPPATKRCRTAPVSIMAPVELRHRDVFTLKHQVGEGTYGSVFVAQDKASNEIVALKRINTKQEANGFPITAIREVKILKALSHSNVVTLKEIVTSSERREKGEFPQDVFMVFEYLEYDLTGILDTPEIRFTQDHIKSWAHQLLTGVHYMHLNNILHRDLKASNLLINKRGVLKIADLGLARSYSSDMGRLTNMVITLWYRPPELLLGSLDYSSKVDMWSAGCIIAEMFRRSGFLKGATEAAQLDLIFRTFGHPSVKEWPELETKCKAWSKYKPKLGDAILPCRLEEALKHGLTHPKWLTPKAVELLTKLMTMNPNKRWSAQEALLSEYFFEWPAVKKPEQLSMNFAVQSIHEWDCRKKFEAAKLARARQNKGR